MNIKDLINNEYAQVCQRIGHLTSNKEKIEEELKLLKSQVRALDESQAKLGELAKLAAAQKNSEALAVAKAAEDAKAE